MAETRESDLISQIESLTPNQIRAKLTAAGIRPGSKWRGYRQAKRVIFQGMGIDSDIYDRHMATICKILGL